MFDIQSHWHTAHKRSEAHGMETLLLYSRAEIENIKYKRKNECIYAREDDILYKPIIYIAYIMYLRSTYLYREIILRSIIEITCEYMEILVSIKYSYTREYS